MRLQLAVTVLFLSVTSGACAQTAVAPATAPAAAPATSAAPAGKVKYNSENTEIGVLLDDPAAKAIVEKNLPGWTTNDQIDMARSMTLKGIQEYSPELLTDAKLAAIDADLAKLGK